MPYITPTLIMYSSYSQPSTKPTYGIHNRSIVNRHLDRQVLPGWSPKFFCCSIKPSHQFWTCFDVGGVNSENFPESTYDFLPLFPCGVSKVLFLFWETPVYARTHTHTRTRFHFITASRRNHFFQLRDTSFIPPEYGLPCPGGAMVVST